MTAEPVIVVLCGGTSAEREVSLGSGKACALALARSFRTRWVDVTTDALPAGLDPARDVAFLSFHGGWGEGGGVQRALEAAGFSYGGCDAAGSEQCLDKARTKAAAAAAGVHVAPGLVFSAEQKPDAVALVALLGPEIVFKPSAEGSSVGLAIVAGREAVAEKLAAITRGTWLAEQRVVGREITVGLLGGRALGVVEIRPHSGVFDFGSKYTKGATEYLAPAPLDAATTRAAQNAAEQTFAACGARDYARADFIVNAAGHAYLLEINTLPGMKETSLLPMSARCAGLDFTALVREMIAPAVQRHREARR